MLIYQLNESRNLISYPFFKIKGKEILYKLYGNTEWQTIDRLLLNVDKHNTFCRSLQKEMIWAFNLNNLFLKH